jgi:hypothetical protein
LKTGLYTLAGGHMYFNDKVIKMRYDLPKKTSEIDYFDQYEDLLNLDESLTIAQGPFNSISYHK